MKPGTYANERSGTRFEVTEASPERLRFRRTYPPDTGRADPHYHRDFEQAWTVAEGTGTVEVDGEEREVGAGQAVEIAIDTPHRDIFNAGAQPLVVDWAIEPNTAFIQAFADAYVYLLERDELNEQEEFPMLQLFSILNATKGQSYAPGIPVPLQKAIFPVAALVARLRGYRPRYD